MSRQLDTKITGYTAADCIYTFLAEGIDPDTGVITAIDISALTIVFTVDDTAGGEKWVGGVATGITRTGIAGEFTVWIPLTTMQDLDPGEYRIGCTMSDGTVTTMILRGSLTVQDGIVG